MKFNINHHLYEIDEAQPATAIVEVAERIVTVEWPNLDPHLAESKVQDIVEWIRELA
jgi:hypothetical protein